MSEKRHLSLTAALALIAALCFTAPASALPVGSAPERGFAAWTLDSVLDWFQSFFAARWADPDDASSLSANPETVGSIGGGSGGTGGIWVQQAGGLGVNIIPDGSPGAGSP